MGQSSWEKFFAVWETGFYAIPFILLAQIITIICGFIFFKKDKLHILFLAYAFAGLLLFLVIDIAIAFTNAKGKSLVILVETTNTLFAMIESIVFGIYFNSLLKLKAVTTGIKFFYQAFGLFILILFIKLMDPDVSERDIRQYSNFLTSFQLLFFGTLCFLYYKKLFKEITTIRLTGRPSFWIVSSTFLYSLLLLPYFVISYRILLTDIPIFRAFCFIHYISFGLVFISIANAFIWRKPLTV